ncbi:MAG: hypothetical protein GQ582_02835 [Methyloprofundus sp.]|nr:hypothetical protein [Methyloprofundus sp.]
MLYLPPSLCRSLRLHSAVLLNILLVASNSVSAISAGETFFANLESNQWRLVDTNTPSYAPHGGWAIDSANGRIFTFGSDTHGQELPDNSVHIFDADTLTWAQSYAPDPTSSYIKDADNWTYTTNGNPWASHTFDNLAYLPEQNALLVVTAPAHNYTGKADALTSPDASSWFIADQSWLYDISNNSWSFLKNANTPSSHSADVWARSLSYNPDLGKVVAAGGFATSFFDPITQLWETLSTSNQAYGIHASSEYNPISQKTFMFGGSRAEPNILSEYTPETLQWEVLTTTGPDPIKAEGAKIALDTVNDVLIYLSVTDDANSYSNPTGASSTHILDLHTNEWVNANLDFNPVNSGLGFSMGYVEAFDVSLYHNAEGLWAYRYETAALPVPTLPTGSLFLVGLGAIAYTRRKTIK